MDTSDRIARLRHLMDERGYDAVLLRNNADLRWLTGARGVFDFETAHTALVSRDELRLHTDSRYYNAFVERMGDDGAWTIDMEQVDAADWAARAVLEKGVHFLAIEDTVSLRFYSELQSRLAARSAATVLAQLHGDLVEMRAVKDADEIRAMRDAQAVTDAAFGHMLGMIQPGLSEMRLRAELDNYMLSNGADNLAFESIVASGPNTANPHAHPGARVVERGDFVLMDFGASLGDYRSDMTRTVVVGNPSDLQRRIYDIVRSTHEACAAQIRPGKVGREIHELAVRLIEEAGYGDYFKHGLGHGVGIDIHEQPCFGKRDAHTLVPGNVVTVEPGIYLPGFGGVRLEDFGVVTEDGFEPFTASTHELVVLDA